MQSFPSTPFPFLLFLISQESRGAAAGRSNGGGDPPYFHFPGGPTPPPPPYNQRPSLPPCLCALQACVCVCGWRGRAEREVSISHLWSSLLPPSRMPFTRGEECECAAAFFSCRNPIAWRKKQSPLFPLLLLLHSWHVRQQGKAMPTHPPCCRKKGEKECVRHKSERQEEQGGGRGFIV